MDLRKTRKFEVTEKVKKHRSSNLKTLEVQFENNREGQKT